jgi:predicted amidohydrolase
MRIALVSLDQRWHDKDANFARCEAFAAQARAAGSELLVFPEMTLTGYSMDVEAIVEPAAASPTVARFDALARRVGIDVIYGACLAGGPSLRPRNELRVARADGAAIPPYAKVHPFSFAGEDRVLEPGASLGVAALQGVTLGTSICYDLRFPELYAAMAPRAAGAVVIASWPAARVSHWRALLVARAIENQFYAIGVNRTGTDGHGLPYERCSMVVRPSGEVVAPQVSDGELDVYELDLAAVERYRRAFPTIRDKRPALYPHLGAGAA